MGFGVWGWGWGWRSLGSVPLRAEAIPSRSSQVGSWSPSQKSGETRGEVVKPEREKKKASLSWIGSGVRVGVGVGLRVRVRVREGLVTPCPPSAAHLG